MYVGVTLWYGCGGMVSVCRLRHSTHKSQAPEDGCINIRNMLSIIQYKEIIKQVTSSWSVFTQYNHLFQHLTMAIFRLYMKYLVSSYSRTRLIWAVYSGEVGGEVGTRSRMCHGGWEVWVHEYNTIDLTILT